MENKIYFVSFITAHNILLTSHNFSEVKVTAIGHESRIVGRSSNSDLVCCAHFHTNVFGEDVNPDTTVIIKTYDKGVVIWSCLGKTGSRHLSPGIYR